ncbi:serine palmitoyltransferase [Nematocida sp. AWRm77]|nr:serine palmitoyltransferase [Nematocida sp. AWRm77]
MLETLKDILTANALRWSVEIGVAGILMVGTLVYFARERKKEPLLSEEDLEEALKHWEPLPLGETAEEREKEKEKEKEKGERGNGKNEREEKEEGRIKSVKYSLAAFDPFVFTYGSKKIVEGLPGETTTECLEKKAKLKHIIDKYGVGTCGPRGFYGTLDLQLQLEEALARSLGVEGVVLYSHALLAISSVIKCFCKSHGAAIFYDHRSSLGIRRAIFAARSKAILYTSPADLSTKLSLEHGCKKFVITEGIFEETGETADISAIVRIKKKHNALLILDESISIPMLGSKGCVGFFGIPASEVDLWVGSLASGYGSAGGFCGGAKEVSDQQRLSSLAYCFSASLPGFLAHYAYLNLESVIFWETIHEDACKEVHEGSSDEESETVFTFAPELEYPIQRLDKSPKFAPRFQREKNKLVNSKSVHALVKLFNAVARSTGTSVRAKNDVFTSIVRLVVQEECEKRELVQAVHRAFVKEGILTRTAEFPEPSIIFTIDNATTIKTSEEIGKHMAQIVTHVYKESMVVE